MFFSICLNVLQQGVASQYSYSASSYAGQQAAAPSSAASAAYGQPQAYAQPGYAPQAYQVSHLLEFICLRSFAGNAICASTCMPTFA